eukprot:g4287.t1
MGKKGKGKYSDGKKGKTERRKVRGQGPQPSGRRRSRTESVEEHSRRSAENPSDFSTPLNNGNRDRSGSVSYNRSSEKLSGKKRNKSKHKNRGVVEDFSTQGRYKQYVHFEDGLPPGYNDEYSSFGFGNYGKNDVTPQRRRSRTDSSDKAKYGTPNVTVHDQYFSPKQKKSHSSKKKDRRRGNHYYEKLNKGKKIYKNYGTAAWNYGLENFAEGDLAALPKPIRLHLRNSMKQKARARAKKAEKRTSRLERRRARSLSKDLTKHDVVVHKAGVLHQLPDEMLLHILANSGLDACSLACIESTCRFFRKTFYRVSDLSIVEEAANMAVERIRSERSPEVKDDHRCGPWNGESWKQLLYRESNPCLYVLGGWNRDFGNLDSVERFVTRQCKVGHEDELCASSGVPFRRQSTSSSEEDAAREARHTAWGIGAGYNEEAALALALQMSVTDQTAAENGTPEVDSALQAALALSIRDTTFSPAPGAEEQIQNENNNENVASVAADWLDCETSEEEEEEEDEEDGSEINGHMRTNSDGSSGSSSESLSKLSSVTTAEMNSLSSVSRESSDSVEVIEMIEENPSRLGGVDDFSVFLDGEANVENFERHKSNESMCSHDESLDDGIDPHCTAALAFIGSPVEEYHLNQRRISKLVSNLNGTTVESNENDTTSNEGEVASPETDEQVTKERVVCEEGVPMPVARRNFGAAVVRGKLFVLGGEQEQETLSSVFCFDPQPRFKGDRGKWREITALPAARCNLAVAAAGQRIYVSGGLNRVLEPTTTVERYHTRKGNWKEIAVMRSARYSHAAVIVGPYMYCIAGYDNSNTPSRTVEALHLPTGNWFPQPSLRVCSGRVQAVVWRGYIVVVDGWQNVEALPMKAASGLDFRLRKSSVPRGPPRGPPPPPVSPSAANQNILWQCVKPKEIEESGDDEEKDSSSSKEEYESFVKNGERSDEKFVPCEVGKWQSWPRLTTRRRKFGMCVWNGNIIVLGGYNEYGSCLNTVEQFSASLQSWEFHCSFSIGRDALAVAS